MIAGEIQSHSKRRWPFTEPGGSACESAAGGLSGKMAEARLDQADGHDGGRTRDVRDAKVLSIDAGTDGRRELHPMPDSQVTRVVAEFLDKALSHDSPV